MFCDQGGIRNANLSASKMPNPGEPTRAMEKIHQNGGLNFKLNFAKLINDLRRLLNMP
jgi:hypothetical protein